MKRINIFLAVFLITILSAKAQFGGGNGTQINPYLINSVEHLVALGDSVKAGNSYTNQYFKLTTNLDLADWCTSHVSTGGWEPIGDAKSGTTCFGGNFNGAGYEIQNLTINRTSEYQGLFGCVSGSIDSLGITTANIVVNNSNSGVGGLAGKSNLANIQNCYVIGTVEGNDYVGGLVGWQSKGFIQNCYTIVSATGNHAIGGLVGLAGDRDGKIQNSYTNCIINGRYNVGGLVGSSAGTIENCYVVGNITGSSIVGGLIGRNQDNNALIQKCYMIGVINGRDTVGGIAGSNTAPNAKIQTCVVGNTLINSTGSNVHRISGQTSALAFIRDCYALDSLKINGNPIDASQYDSLEGISKSILELYTQNTYEGLDWDFTSGTGDWKMCNANSFPFLAWQECEPIGNIPVTNVSLNKHALLLKIDHTEGLMSTIIPNNATNQNKTWESRDENIATVDNNGLITGIAVGSTYIVVTTQDGNFKDSCLVSVTEDTDIAVTGITLDEHSLSLKVDSTETLLATISPNNATNPNKTWESRDENIATVDNNGLVTAIAEGETYIVVTTQDWNFQDSCLVTVIEDSDIAVTGVTLNEHTLSLKVDSMETLTATITPNNATNPNKTWESRDENIATVDNNGLVTGIAVGSTYIVVTTQDGNFQDSCLVTVSEDSDIAVTGIALNKRNLSLKVDSTETLLATITPNNASNQNKTWQSRDESIATVDNNGLVTAIAEGETYIVVTTAEGGFKDSCLVTVEGNVGINDVENQAKTFKIYPNPTSGKLIIENEDPTTKTAELFDLNGRLISTFKVSNKKTEVDISRLPNGTYLIKFGNTSTKVVKQ